jgi:hypothetical protein
MILIEIIIIRREDCLMLCYKIKLFNMLKCELKKQMKNLFYEII